MNSIHRKAHLAFKDGILSLKFHENTVVEVEDVIYIYCFGVGQSQGKPYGVLFDSSSKHEFSEEAMAHLSDSKYLDSISAMAYISKDMISKIRLSLLMIFERPKLRPKLFNDETEGYQWLQQQLGKPLRS